MKSQPQLTSKFTVIYFQTSASAQGNPRYFTKLPGKMLCGLILALLCAATLTSARPAATGMQPPERDDRYPRTTVPPHSDRNAPDDGAPTQPSSGVGNTESGDGEVDPCLNIPGISQRPPAECIHWLRHQGNNYRNILFAYAETLELEFDSSGGRRRRGDEDDDCNNILGELNSEAVPWKTSTCPHQFSCQYRHDRYPRYSISASCVSYTDNSNPNVQCNEYGRVSLLVLERQLEACADGSGMCTTNWRKVNSEVTHGCQKVSGQT